MRTRFLNTDYFNSAPILALEFLRLPIPQPPHLNRASFEELRCFDDLPYVSISLEIETLPIDDAFSKFFSYVFPHRIKSGVDVFARNLCCSQSYNHDDDREFGSQTGGHDDDGDSGSQELTQVRNEKGENMAMSNGMGGNCFGAVLFEMPEIDLPLENACFSDEQRVFSETPDAEINMDMTNVTFGVNDLFEIPIPDFLVDKIRPESYTEQKADLLEDNGLVQGQIHVSSSAFPTFEVDEMSLGIYITTSVNNTLLFLENIETLQGVHEYGLIGDNKELLGSMQLEFFSDHCLSKKCLGTGLSCSDVAVDLSIISIMEFSSIEQNFLFPQERSNDYLISSTSPILFEEFQFFNLGTSLILEVFTNSAAIIEAEACEQMFSETGNFRNFNEMIVSHELNLLDDYFRSLPVPLLSDYEKIRPLHVIVKETLAQLKLQPSSAFDEIYLDWHLLEEDDCHHGKYSSCWKMLGENDMQNLDCNLYSIDDRMVVFDFAITDDGPNGFKTEENKETLNMYPGCFSSTSRSLNQTAMTKLQNDGCEKAASGEVLFSMNTEKVALLTESVSQFGDLDFFLNDREFVAGKNHKFAANTFQKGESYSFPVLSDRNCKLEKLLNFIPVEDRCNSSSFKDVDEVKSSSIPLPVPCMPFSTESNTIHVNIPSCPDTIIIVNTQNFDHEMIISRRSTYQKILATEKEGAQVVERDLNVPVDLVLTAAVCLGWYDCRNIGGKSSTPNEASSFLHVCVENIAANVLTSLSFAFSTGILVFEGESNFIASIMESSDELYAAAATLGIDLQLFYSYSSEMTDEIILSCITCAHKFTKGLYPLMPESETLAEAFLASFPSMNPLSAHVILSCRGMLVEFLECQHDHRISAVKKYHVPDESIILLSALCRYGEREDSKSGMTDCSSSVSSAPDSENCRRSESGRRKRKCIGSSQSIEMPMDDLIQFKPSKIITADCLKSSKMFKPSCSWISRNPEIFDEASKPSVSIRDMLLGQKQGLTSSQVCEQYECSKGLKMLDDIEHPILPLDDIFCRQNQGIDMFMLDKLDAQQTNTPGIWQENFIGEVQNIDDSSLFGEILSTANSAGSFPIAPGKEKSLASRVNKTARKISLSKGSFSTFPTAAEINSNSEAWISNAASGLRKDTNQYSDTDFNNDNMSLNHQKSFLESGMLKLTTNFNRQSFQGINQHSDYADVPSTHQKKHPKGSEILKAATNFHKPSFKGTDVPHCDGTSLSNAVQSGQPQQGSPWTIEFLNRIREKSKLRQHSHPTGSSSPSVSYFRNTSKATKRKNLSILDFYKYQGCSTYTKGAEQKRQRQSLQPSSSSMSEKTPLSSVPTWTPVDKRARRRLSNVTKESAGQSKLVWSSNNDRAMNRRL